MTTTTELVHCRRCRNDKPPEEFATDRSTKTGRNAYCRTCRAAWAREYRRANPTYDHRRRLHSRYGITAEQYESMLEAQDYRCAICRGTSPGGNGGRTFAVDHDHTTGTVRGLLCAPCNTGLARFEDDPDRLFAAVRYLQADR